MHSSSALPPFEGLSAVIAAHQTGSFSAAAATLGITHGAVSRRIQAVEHWLGTPLFERYARGVRTTPAGQRFVAMAEQALSMIQDSADRWRRPDVAVPHLRLSAVPSLARLWLMSRMPILQGSPRDVHIELQLEHRVLNLEAGETDLAIRYGAGRWKGCASRLLFGERLYPVAASSIAARLGANAKVARIAALPLLHDSDKRQWRSWFDAVGLRVRAKDEDRRFEEYDLVLAAAESGLGVALLRMPLAHSYVNSGRLVRVSRTSVANELGNYLVMRRDESREVVLRVAERLQRAAAELNEMSLD